METEADVADAGGAVTAVRRPADAGVVEQAATAVRHSLDSTPRPERYPGHRLDRRPGANEAQGQSA